MSNLQMVQTPDQGQFGEVHGSQPGFITRPEEMALLVKAADSILVVDDNHGSRRLCTICLEEQFHLNGKQVYTANGPDSAMIILRGMTGNVLVLTDMRMNEQNDAGLHFLMQIDEGIPREQAVIQPIAMSTVFSRDILSGLQRMNIPRLLKPTMDRWMGFR
ncbi:hypothetical protein ACFLY9_00715 [Patescibacteria group bacterium]